MGYQHLSSAEYYNKQKQGLCQLTHLITLYPWENIQREKKSSKKDNLQSNTFFKNKYTMMRLTEYHLQKATVPLNMGLFPQQKE